MQNWGNLILHFFFYKQVAPTGKFSVDNAHSPSFNHFHHSSDNIIELSH
jgi:hypothetical protein